MPESHYEIRVRGILDDRWSEWFEGLTLVAEGLDTVITGRLPDQASLHGVLNKVRDLGLFLISVRHISADETSNGGDPS